MKALVALLLCALPASAEVQLQSVSWRLAKKEKAAPATLTELSQLSLAPKAASVDGRLIARVKFLNRGKACEAMLMRYALTGKIAANGSEPAWVVPFAIDERRVPKVAANTVQEVDVDVTTMLNLYLKRLARDEISLRELKLNIMVSPRKHDKALTQLESLLAVAP